MKVHYFKVLKSRQDYFGERYFKVNWNDNYVTQICFGNSELRGRGRSNNIGVYYISKVTFTSNYLMSYVEPTTKRVWDRNFEKIVKALT